jgi:hypothetical protein
LSDQPASAAVGQVSADGQFRWNGVQWVPIPRGAREATPWTRPMQMATAAVFALGAIYSVVISFAYVNHDSMLRAMKAQGQSFPSGSDVDTIVNAAVVFSLGFFVFIAVCEQVIALGSYLAWRWMFWVALVLLALSGLGGLTNLSTFARPETSPIPVWAVAISEVFALASLGLFVWLLIGAIRFGPWAMKKPGA